MPPKVLLLTGAPNLSSLDWESSNLLEDFTVPVARFAGLLSAKDPAVSSLATGQSRYASWRSIDLKRQPFTTGHSQGQEWLEGYQGNAIFFATSDLTFISSIGSSASQSQLSYGSSTESVQEVLSQFYEHSFAIHSTVTPRIQDPSSAKESDRSDAGNGISFGSSATSITPTMGGSLANSPFEATLPQRSIPLACQLSELKEMPSAAYILSIQPQTMTVNLIVGIISVSTPRRIKTRRGAEVELVELLVGDETKSGFGINFWLSANSTDSNECGTEADIRSTLGNLRPQDLVLLKNIAISSFRDRVHGQSLRRGMTKVHLLYRNRVDRSDIGGCYTAADLEYENNEQISRTKRVKEWVQRFIGPGLFQRAGKGSAITTKEDLPPDTP